jgi:hypothetical protein
MKGGRSDQTGLPSHRNPCAESGPGESLERSIGPQPPRRLPRDIPHDEGSSK